MANYSYDAWGNLVSITNNSGTDITSNTTGIAYINPIRYRGYYYDTETGFYYLQSRYYDPAIGRFISADEPAYLGASSIPESFNLFAYCGNNPVNALDPNGHDWLHWIIGAGIVVGAAAATVATCGWSLPLAAGAITSVASGTAAATTATTVSAGAFIGSSAALGTSAIIAASNSATVEDFRDQGNWGTVTATAGGAFIGSAFASLLPKSDCRIYPPNNGFNSTPRNSILTPNSLLQRIGDTTGRFVAPINTAAPMLSLPPDKIGAHITNLKVLLPIQVQAGTAMPWFNQPGGGTQFLLPASIEELVASGHLIIIP